MSALEMVLLVFTGLLGLIVGSFLNVCIYRVPQRNFFADKRSYCPKCGATIKFYDNIPVISYIVLGGKCRACKARISPRYPIVELLNALLWIAAFCIYRVSWITPIYMTALSLLVVTAFIDIDTREIPNGIVVALTVLGLICFAPITDVLWYERLIGMICVSLPCLAIALFGGMGGGDVKLFFALGLLLGWKLILVAAFFAVVTGGIAGAVMLVKLRGKEGAEREMAFGPYIALGAAAAMLAGGYILEGIRSFVGAL